ATCTARSAPAAPRRPLPCGSAGGEPGPTSWASGLAGDDELLDLEPGGAVAVDHLEAVGDRLEDAPEPEPARLVRELVADGGAVDGGDRRLQRPAPDLDLEYRLRAARHAAEQALDRQLEILEALERQLEAGTQAGDDEQGDPEQVPAGRETERDRVAGG